MIESINCDSDGIANYSSSEKRINLSKSKEIVTEKSKVKELFNRDLNKNIAKLCTESDSRIKYILSNTTSGITTSTSKFSSKKTSSLFGTTSKLSSLDTNIKLNLHDASIHSVNNTSKYNSSNYRNEVNSSFHFNTEIDNVQDEANTQLTVIKILKLQDLAHKMEQRQIYLIKNTFRSVPFKRSYIDGFEEGFRYGYFDNPNEKFTTISNITTEKTNKTTENTYNDFDSIIKKDTANVLPEIKDSERMRGGYQDSQQQQNIVKDNTPSNISKSVLDVVKSPKEITKSGITITNEFPTKCNNDVNIQAFDKKYDNFEKVESKYTQDVNMSAINFNETDRVQHYLQYYAKMLNSLDEEFAKGFKEGFSDGFVAGNIYIPAGTTFSEDEKEYISEMRKKSKYYEDGINSDIKKLYGRAIAMKKNLNISSDKFKDTSLLVQKVASKIPLKFSKNDYKFYNDMTKRNRKNTKPKSMYEDDSDTIMASYVVNNFIPQHTKSRAINYLTKHKINEFFQFLGSHLMASKPDDPISFLINLLEKCIDYRLNELVIPAPLLFTKKHVESIYFVLDPMVTGYIDINQYIHGMESLGITDMNDSLNFRPGEKIDKYIFITNACRRLLNKFREMIAMDTATTPPQAAYTNI